MQNEVLGLKKQVRGQVDSMVSVFEQMKMQIISVLKDEEHKIIHMETDLIEKNKIIQDNERRWKSNKQATDEESYRLRVYYENLMVDQKTRMTKDYDFSYEEKLIGVNKIYEDRIRKIEDAHHSRIGELNGMMAAMKIELDQKSDDKKTLEDRLAGERAASSTNLAESFSSNKAVVSMLNQRILELESKNHQLVTKHSDETLSANDKMSTIIADMNSNINSIRISYEHTLSKKDDEIISVRCELTKSRSDSEQGLLRKEEQIMSLKADLLKAKRDIDAMECRLREGVHEAEVCVR